jgi:ATP-dependent DNA helicase RecG
LNEILLKKVQYLKGVGPAKSKALAKLDIFTLDDVITHYPRRYEDHSRAMRIIELSDGEMATVKGIVANITETKPRRNMSILKIAVGDESGYVQLVWFNQPFLKKKFSRGQKIIASGKVSFQYNYCAINNPEFEIIEGDEEKRGRIEPIYPVNEMVSQKLIRSLIESMKDIIENLTENIPQEIVAEYALMPRAKAVWQIHFPENEDALNKARERLAFEDLYFIQCGLALLKRQSRKEQRGIKHLMNSALSRSVRARLPFSLTADQEKALQEICFDMQQPIPMQRLLQGDVGSGKTVVAALALVKTVENGYQGALMAPTEILAAQHFESLNNLLAPCKISVGLLTGSLPKKKRDAMREKIKNGEVDIVIGTHALIQDEVEFKNMGLVVTDEQHRFGVRQRNALQAKGNLPDVLVMTATPIPRTMTLTVYGDLDVSVIKQLPPGRKPISTFVRQPNKRDLIYKFVLKEIENGRQAYVVCPLIEISDKMDTASAEELYEELSSTYFKNVKCGIVHGKLAVKEKESVMNSFYEGEIKLLVATTVIEVGVNVPNASVMVIEGADRFGLAQLHQLRGRIGRGEYKSYCILLSQNKSDATKERLAIMEKTSDGFILAEEDLKLRGPGQFFGTRQHGLPDLKIADIINDIDILLKAREASLKTINSKALREKATEYITVKYREHFEGLMNN